LKDMIRRALIGEISKIEERKHVLREIEIKKNKLKKKEEMENQEQSNVQSANKSGLFGSPTKTGGVGFFDRS